MEKKFQTSEGSNGHNTTTRALIAVKLTTENANKEPVELSEVIGARGQYEDVFESMDIIVPALRSYICSCWIRKPLCNLSLVTMMSYWLQI